jgi:hypothetical protein
MSAALHKPAALAAAVGPVFRADQGSRSYRTYVEAFRRRSADVPAWARDEAGLFASLLHNPMDIDPKSEVRFFWVGSDGQKGNWYFSVTEAVEQAKNRAGLLQQYIGLNTLRPFFIRRRLPRPKFQQRALYVDLDYGHESSASPWAGYDAGDVYHAALDKLFDAGVPSPSIAVATGRGLQLVWRTTPGWENRAKKAMERLQEALKEFAPDPSCVDFMRVFRLPGTINSKTGTYARILAHDQHRYDFEELFSSLAELGELKPRRRPQPAPAERSRAASRRPHWNGKFDPKARLNGLQMLINGHWHGRVPEGSRNLMAHYAASCIVLMPGNALANVKAWCEQWLPDHDEGEVERTVATAERKLYRYHWSTIAKRLGIPAKVAAALQLSMLPPRTREQHAAEERERRKRKGATPRAESAARTILGG